VASDSKNTQVLTSETYHHADKLNNVNFYPKFSEVKYSYSDQEKGKSLLLMPSVLKDVARKGGGLNFLTNDAGFTPCPPQFSHDQQFSVKGPKKILTHPSIKELMRSYQISSMEAEANENALFNSQIRKATIIFRNDEEEMSSAANIKVAKAVAKAHPKRRRHESTMNDSERFIKSTLELYGLVEEVSALTVSHYASAIAQLKSAHQPFLVKEHPAAGHVNRTVKQSLAVSNFKHPRELFDEFHALVLLLSGSSPMAHTRVHMCVTRKDSHEMAPPTKRKRGRARRTVLNADMKTSLLSNIHQVSTVPPPTLLLPLTNKSPPPPSLS
jgi:hypothetical protein